MYKELAEKFNIEYCEALLFDSIKSRIDEKKLKRLYERVESPKTVIFFLFPYFVSNAPGNISKYARGLDYHVVVGGILREISSVLYAEHPDNTFLPFTDSSPIPEVYGAAAAGLGVIGENRLLINEKYGTYCFIGEIVTDLLLECALGEPQRCSGCGKCKTACPTRALCGEGECVSYLTQKKGALSSEELEILKKHPLVWGCDICQEACPENAAPVCTKIPQFKDVLIENIDFDTLKSLGDAPRSFLWRGEAVLIRNLKNRE